MLYTRTKRTAAAVLLGIGGLLVASAAHAQRDALNFAQETLETTGSTKVDGVGTFYNVTVPDTNPDTFTVTIGLAAIDQLQMFARVEYTNLIVKEGDSFDVVTNQLTGDPATCTSSVGTAAFVARREKGKVAIYNLGATARTANWCMVFTSNSAPFQVMKGSGSFSAKVTLYTDLRDALFGTAGRELSTSGAGTIGRVTPAVSRSVKAASTAAIADVEKGFAAFTTGNSANLATVSVKATHIAYPLDNKGTPADTSDDLPQVDLLNDAGVPLTSTTAAALVKSATATFSGDLSVGTFTLGGTGCPGALTVNSDKNEAVGMIDGVADSGEEDEAGAVTCTFNMNVAKNATAQSDDKDDTEYTPLKQQEFMADLSVMLTTDSPAYPTSALTDQKAGEIDRNGTTVRLPYLTTMQGYSQQVVLVNRGTRSADFWIEGLMSDGTDATGLALAAAPMTIDGETSMSVAVSDLVDLGTDGSEGSATLAVNAAPADVSVLTMLKNLATGSTDTLEHDPM